MKTVRLTALVMFCCIVCPLRGHAEASSLIRGGTLLSLEETLGRALKDSAQVRRAEARLEKEEALLRAAKRRFFPKIGTDLYTAATSEDHRGILFWKNEMRLPIFEGGRLIHEKRKKDLQVQEGRLRLKETRETVSYEVKAIYITLLKEKELTRLAQEWVSESGKLYQTMKFLYEQEIITREELFRWEALSGASQHELLKHKEALDYAEVLIAELTGVKEGERIELEPLGEVRFQRRVFRALLSELRNNNPVYEIVNTRVREKEEEKKALRSERFPKLGLSTRFNRAKDSFVDQNRFELGVVGSWNIWDFGVLGNEIAAKDAEIKEMTEEGRIETTALEHEARKILGDLKVAWAKIQSMKSLLKEKKESYQNQKTRLIAGDKGKAEIFDSFVSLTQIQMGVVEALSDYRLLQARLERIIGKGLVNEKR